MDEKKINSTEENKKAVEPAKAPPVKELPVKNDNGKKKKLLAVLIPVMVIIVAAAIVVAVVLKKNNDEPVKIPVHVTDENGIAVTDVNGEVVTYYAETEYVAVTDTNGETIKDSDGKVVTTAVYVTQNVEVNVAVTDENGKVVVDENGEVVTEKVVYEQDPNQSVGKPIVVGTTVVPFTDGQGNTATNAHNGEVVTQVIPITSSPVNVEPASLDWKTSYGGTAQDYFSDIATDSDGNYIAANVTNSKDGDAEGFAELKYAAPYTVLVKYDKSGNVKWEKAVGSTRGICVLTEIVPTEDGGFYAVGYGKNIAGERGKGFYDCAVYKFDKNGEEQWHKIFGTSTVDLFYGATLTNDGGIVAVGSVGNNDGDAEGFGKKENQSAACIVKYDSAGNIVWKNVVGSNADRFEGVAEGNDGSLYCVGVFYSSDFFTNLGKSDGGVIKFNSKGEYKESFRIAGTGDEEFTGIVALKNGGVAVVGNSDSSDTTETESFFVDKFAARGKRDAYIIKINDDMSLGFAKTFRGQNNDKLVDIAEKEDGSLIVAGESDSTSRDLKGVTTRGGTDIVIASFDKFGNLSWARSFGGKADDSAKAICLAEKGGYVVAGSSLSTDTDMEGISQYVTGKSVGVIAKFPE